MLDIKFIRENKELVEKNNKRRNCKIDVDDLLELDDQYRKSLRELELLRAERNKVSNGKKPTFREITRMQGLKEKISKLENIVGESKKELDEKLSFIPNLLASDVPFGKSDEDNVPIKHWGKIPKFNFKALSHEEIGEKLDLIDMKRASKVSQARFYYLKNKAVFLRLALVQFALDTLVKQGFTPFVTPHLTHQKTLYGTGYLPFAKEDIYKIEGEDLSLIGTSEQPLVAYHTNEILDAKDLPKLYAGISSCFRTEAGSYGKDTQGILRVHEFYKVEQIVFCTSDTAEKWHQKCLEIEEELCQKLELPYRVVNICDADLGAPGYKKYDVEVWFPSQNKYREVTSNTNLTDFQTRRLNIRAKKKNGEVFYPYTISATAVTDRHLIAILENHQQKDGTFKLPQVLKKWYGAKN